ncbi:FAD-dependent monooxygenase [Streptomyces koyangensis]|uniref:FAD-dependent monooxygenase n=1 Tax=Streptomyces koyangensis TaxID=188770 RepID=UPI003C2C128B
MRTLPSTILVVGGGITGSTMAVLLRRVGLDVELAEAAPDWNTGAGSGITLHGNALRVLREAGVWDEVRMAGHGFGTIGLTAVDGSLLHEERSLPAGGDDLPATFGIERPRLQSILAAAVRASGVRVRLGVRAQVTAQYGNSVEVAYNDSESRRYALVIAADGLHSTLRAAVGITDTPKATGMAAWRAIVPRPPGLDRTNLTYGAPVHIAGYCPTGPDTIYAYLVESTKPRSELPPPASHAAHMRALAAPYGGHWPAIRAHLTDSSQVNYSRFSRLLVRNAWHRGRVVLAGDAAHSCPPTLAQGAAMGLEDASVLSGLLADEPPAAWDDALLTRYHDRRSRRAATVVEASVRIGRWLLDSSPHADIPHLMNRTMTMLRQMP